MGQILHGSATTTEAVRRAIQHSQESLRGLAKRYGVDPKTGIRAADLNRRKADRHSTRDLAVAASWLKDFYHDGRDGVIAKKLDAPYLSGERGMLRSSGCGRPIVWWAAFAIRVGPAKSARCCSVSIIRRGCWTTSASPPQSPMTSVRRSPASFARSRRASGIHRRRSRRAQPLEHGAAANRRPLRPELVVAVRYDNATVGRFRHGTKLLRWRPDKPAQSA